MLGKVRDRANMHIAKIDVPAVRALGIAAAGDGGDAIGNRVEQSWRELEMAGFSALGRSEDDRAASAHGGSAQQRRRSRRGVIRRGHGP